MAKLSETVRDLYDGKPAHGIGHLVSGAAVQHDSGGDLDEKIRRAAKNVADPLAAELRDLKQELNTISGEMHATSSDRDSVEIRFACLMRNYDDLKDTVERVAIADPSQCGYILTHDRWCLHRRMGPHTRDLSDLRAPCGWRSNKTKMGYELTSSPHPARAQLFCKRCGLRPP